MPTPQVFKVHRLGLSRLAVFAAVLLLSVPLAAKIVVAGTAMDPQGKALRGARVSLLSEDGSTVVASELSDKKGRFKFELDQSGAHVLRIEADGFGPTEDAVDLRDGIQDYGEIKLIDYELWQRQLAVEAFNRGFAALQERDQDTAIPHFEKALEHNPTLAQAHAALATIYHEQGRWNETIEAIERFLDLAPGAVDLAPVAFDAYRKTGQRDKARAALALVQDPQQRAGLAIGVFNDGAVAGKAGEVDAAFQFFMEAAVLDPDLAVAHEQLAAIEFDRKNYEACLPHLEKLLALRPANATGLRLRYLAYDQLQDPRVGEALKEHLNVASEGTDAAFLEDAIYLFESGQNEPARRRLVALVEARPKLARAHYQLGLVLASGGAVAEARKHLQHFLELAPNDSEAEAARAMLAQL